MQGFTHAKTKTTTKYSSFNGFSNLNGTTSSNRYSNA